MCCCCFCCRVLILWITQQSKCIHMQKINGLFITKFCSFIVNIDVRKFSLCSKIRWKSRSSFIGLFLLLCGVNFFWNGRCRRFFIDFLIYKRTFQKIFFFKSQVKNFSKWIDFKSSFEQLFFYRSSKISLSISEFFLRLNFFLKA